MSAPHAMTGTWFINGDTACAEGAIAAGCRFFAGYPITPATEITQPPAGAKVRAAGQAEGSGDTVSAAAGKGGKP